MKTNTARRIAVATAALLLVGMLGAGSASAGSQMPAPVVNPSSVAPGEDFTVSGVADCIDETMLTVSIEGLGLSDTVSGGDDWSLDFTAPVDAVPGSYPVTIDGNECSYAIPSVTIVAAATTTTAAPTTTAPPAAEAAVAASPAFTG